MRYITLEEVQQHTQGDSLWIVRDGQVYDVTDFAGRHPGGRGKILSHGGQEVKGVMDSSAHIHTQTAYQILQKYHIGQLLDKDSKDGGPNKRKSKKKHTAEEDPNQKALHGWMEDELINWNEPLYWQVGHLGKVYMEWCHSPVERRIRLFHSEFCEFFSRSPWWMVPVVWLPVMTVYLVFAFMNFMHVGHVTFLPGFYGGVKLSVYSMPFLFALGAFLWSLTEYVVHRWLFHLTPPHWSPTLIRLHFVIHGQHHKAPMDRDRLVFPPGPASIFGISISIFYLSLFPLPMAQTLASGTALGYILYDLIHYYLHHGSPTSHYWRDLKNYHVKHHFVNQQKGFGISHKFWDYYFGTVIPQDA